jgi:hypothetical protein
LSALRLWSIHPKYLDWMGLGALWREGILAQTVLAGETRGWRKHPQLDRFREHSEPQDAVGFYLTQVWVEACSRGYNYTYSKIRRPVQGVESIPITTGQLMYEFKILKDRTLIRTPVWHEKLEKVKGLAEAHPLFRVIEGEVGRWEASYWRDGSASNRSADSHHSATPRSFASS